jgi:LemA protein
MEMLMVPVGILLIVIVWFIATYNGMVRLRNHTHESWSGIDTELKRRYELIPNLVSTVKGYTQHEKVVLEKVVEARTKAVASTGSPQVQAQDENALVGALRSLLAVVEGYPDLKASGNYLKLQEELVNTEDRIQAVRRFYNANVRDYNNRTEVFPSNIAAGMFGFKREEFFEIESACERSAPKVTV